MSQENVEIVRAQYASFGQITEGGKVHSWVLGYFDPNCEYRPVEEVDAIRGHEALIEWTERWLEAWSSYGDQVEEIHVEADHVGAVLVLERLVGQVGADHQLAGLHQGDPGGGGLVLGSTAARVRVAAATGCEREREYGGRGHGDADATLAEGGDDVHRDTSRHWNWYAEPVGTGPDAAS